MSFPTFSGASEFLLTFSFHYAQREDIDDLKSELKAVGATYVFTYTDLADRKEFPRKIEQILGKRELKLALNCVSGSDTTNMSWLLAKKAFLGMVFLVLFRYFDVNVPNEQFRSSPSSPYSYIWWHESKTFVITIRSFHI